MLKNYGTIFYVIQNHFLIILQSRILKRHLSWNRITDKKPFQKQIMNERHGYSAGSNSTSPLSSIQDLSLSLGSSSSSPELKKPAFNVQGRPLTGRHHFAPFRRHLFPPQSEHGLAPMPWQPMLEQRSQPNQSFQQLWSVSRFQFFFIFFKH